MTSTCDLPNLLDDHLPHPSDLLRRLCVVRQRSFAEWTARHRSTVLHEAVQCTLDDAIMLMMAVEYLRRKWPDNCLPLIRTEQLRRYVNISDMGRALRRACPDSRLRQAFSSRIFSGRLAVPERIRQLIFCEGGPPIFEQHDGKLPITIFGDYHQQCLSNPLGQVSQAGD